MKMSFRWYGQSNESFPLEYVRQIPGVRGIVGALFDVPVGENKQAYLRGLASWYSKTANDPANAFDDIPAYALLNLYAGLRSSDGAWDIQVYGKNILNKNLAISQTFNGPAFSVD